MADLVFAGLSYEEIVCKYAQTVTGVCVMRLQNYADAEDCFQNTFLKLLSKAPSFKNEEHLKSWLIKVAIHECYNYIKKNKKIRNRELFSVIQTYIINNFGSKTSVGSLCDYLSKTRKETIRKATIYKYLEILENAKIISKCKRFDMKSRKSINGEEKYYLGDLSFYFATNVDARINYGPVLENIVYNYAKSKKYQVSVGQIGNLEVDFILRDLFDKYSYVQVAYTILGSKETEDREYRPLEQIQDNYPKYVLSLDYLLQNRSGIIHKNIVNLISENSDF